MLNFFNFGCGGFKPGRSLPVISPNVLLSRRGSLGLVVDDVYGSVKPHPDLVAEWELAFYQGIYDCPILNSLTDRFFKDVEVKAEVLFEATKHWHITPIYPEGQWKFEILKRDLTEMLGITKQFLSDYGYSYYSYD